MHEFRRPPGRTPRQAVDGFLNPQGNRSPRSEPPSIPSLPHRNVHSDRLRGLRMKQQRRFDDFSQRPDLVGRGNAKPVPMPISPKPLTAKAVLAGKPLHPVPRKIHGTRPAGQSTIPAQSLLHMTLPGGPLESTKSRQKRQKKRPQTTWGKIRFWGLRAGIAVAVLIIACGSLLFAKGFFSAQKVFKGGGKAVALQTNVAPQLLKGEGSGRINILLLGRGGGNHEGPDLTDTILVVSIDPIDKTAEMLSIPRDLWVTPSGFGPMKINAVFANEKYHDLSINPKNIQKAEQDGINLAEKEVTAVLGIPINYYGLIDFSAFQQAVDTLGGVDLNVTADTAVTDYMYNEDTHKPYVLNVQPGLQHFDGLRALMYSRSRHASARGDFDRTERQRLLIQAMTQKALSAGTYSNPIKLSGLMSAFGDNVSTDFNIKDALALMKIVKNVGPTNIKSIGLADPPNNYVVTDDVNGLSIVRPSAGIGIYTEIQNYVRNTLKDPYIAKENAPIEVLNGAGTPGLATAKSNDLKSFGYNITTVDDAPTSDYAKTVLVDLSAGKDPYTKNYLQEHYSVKAVTKLPDSNIQPAQGTAFVVILGQDATTSNQD